MIDMDALIALMGIPSAVTGFCFWLLQRKIQNQEKEREKQEEARRKAAEKEAADRNRKAEDREKAREQLQIIMVQGTSAAIALAEATAKAVQRIPDAHCNGDMHAALSYAAKIKGAQKDFFREQGIHALLEDE